MKNIIIMLTIILLLCGCSKDKNIDANHPELQTYCDEKYGVEYIRDLGLYRGGITVRLDENGNVIHCKVESEVN